MEHDPKTTSTNRETESGHPTGVGFENWGQEFPATRWSQIFSDEDGVKPTTEILAELASSYWYPLYVYLRRRGTPTADAQDHIQGFLTHLLEGDRLAGIDRTKGRFRSYLLGALNHFVSDVRKRNQAQKRGGGVIPLSIEQERAEKRYQNEPVDDVTPEKLFDRQWTIIIMGQAMDALEREFREKGKEKQFDVLSEYLSDPTEGGKYGGAAENLQLAEGSIRSIVSRMRKRYHELFRAIVAETVTGSEDVDDELRQLYGAFE